MKKVVIVCLNPAIDQFIKLPLWVEGTVMRATYDSTWISGKGVNTTRALSEKKDLQVHLVALTGKETENLLFDLAGDNVQVHLFRAPRTRRNITIASSRGDLISHIQTQGHYDVSPSSVEKILEKTVSLISTEDIVVLSGSLPKNLDKNIYKTFIEKFNEKKAVTLFDSSGEEFIAGLQARPFLIKPNKEEFEFLIKREISDDNLLALANALKELNSLCIPYIALTLGANGVLLFENTTGKVYFSNICIEIPHESVNEIGCGDSFVAGLAYALAHDSSLENVLKTAVSFGVANLSLEGPGVLDEILLRTNQADIIFEELTAANVKSINCKQKINSKSLLHL